MTTDTRNHAVPDTVAAESTAWRRLDDRIPLRLMLAVAVLWAVSLYVVFSLAPAPPAEDPSAAHLSGNAQVEEPIVHLGVGGAEKAAALPSAVSHGDH